MSATRDPTWYGIKISAQKLCNGLEDNILKFIIWNYKESGNHTVHGYVLTTLQKLREGLREYDIVDNSNNEPIPGCSFKIDNFFIQKRPSFFKFLESEWNINLTVAVDFTSSNGQILTTEAAKSNKV